MKKLFLFILMSIGLLLSYQVKADVDLTIEVTNHIDKDVIFYLLYQIPGQPQTNIVYDLKPLEHLETPFNNSQVEPKSISKPISHYFVYASKEPPHNIHYCSNNYVYQPETTMHVEIYPDDTCAIN